MMFRPKIIGFVCNWSLPIGLDLTRPGMMGGHPKIRIVRVMCVGRIDPAIVLDTFAKGADGVMVVGCHPPDCHYIQGNLQAERKIEMLKKLISRVGLEPERLRLEWAYAYEVEHFRKIIDDFRDEITMLGQSPFSAEGRNTSMLLNIEAAKSAAEDFRLRVLVGREKELIEERNVYGEEISQEEFDETMDDAIDSEYVRNRIYLMVKKEPLSVKDLSKHLDVDSRTVLRHIVVLRQRGWVTVDKVEGTSPLYTALEVGR
ncbi:MAG: hydrogenase iron-sulfur subunit [Candidatus Bathyarchaeota archaeon]|nr:hydrogenase iron-sulfur subunit [Candidatus Bathyarchaeota archaeon]